MDVSSVGGLNQAVQQYIAQSQQVGSQIESDAKRIKQATAIPADTAVPVNTIVQQQNMEVAKKMQQDPVLATEGRIGTRINAYA